MALAEAEAQGGGENIDPETGWNLDKVTKVESDDNIIVPVPIGFVKSQVEGEGSVETGFVIKQGDNPLATSEVNEFVWVPVNNISQIANQTSGKDDNGRQNYQGKLYNFSTSGPTEMGSYGQGTESYREPDIVTAYDGNDATSNSSYFTETIGNMTGAEFKKQLQEEFNEMIESVETYGGFYIGRYETGNLKQAKAVVQKNNTDIGSQNWYNMYMKCKTVAEGTEGTSSMIWGCQWDATLKWFLESDDPNVVKYVKDSTDKGNYSGSLLEDGTGSVEEYSVNNIYDIAGNVDDWTLEANYTNVRLLRRWLLRQFWFQLSSCCPQQPLRSEQQRFHHRLPFHTLCNPVNC